MAFLFLPIFDGLFAYKSGFCPLGGAGPGEEASPLPQTETINQNKDLKRAHYRGASATTPTVVVYALKNRRGVRRLGLTATKKIGKAVQRNRARRVLREAWRQLEDRFPPGYDYVLVARVRTAHVKTQEVARGLAAALKKLKLS